MQSFIHADIFFFITTVAVILVTIFIVIAFFYIIQILANFRKISDIIRGGAENVEESIKEVSENLLKNPFIRMFFGNKNKNAGKKKSKSK